MSSGWRDVIPPEDRAFYDAAGYGRRGRRGTSPALLVIAYLASLGDRPDRPGALTP